jgi:acyl carrier protein
MEINTVKSRIKKIIQGSAQLQSADIDENARLHQELGIDSLTLLEVALLIDEEFKTDFTEEELMTMETVQRAGEMVVERLARKAAASPP